MIASTYTDGVLVVHEGYVVMEDYPVGMLPAAVHVLMSVTKSLVGCVAAVIIGGGMLDLVAPLTAYVPELAACGYAGATVRHVLDMRSGIIFSEDYLNPASEFRRLEQCIGWSPGVTDGMPASIYDFLLTLRQGGPHGGPFAYRSCETDVLGEFTSMVGRSWSPAEIVLLSETARAAATLTRPTWWQACRSQRIPDLDLGISGAPGQNLGRSECRCRG